jgi:hypothetical protein
MACEFTSQAIFCSRIPARIQNKFRRAELAAPPKLCGERVLFAKGRLSIVQSGTYLIAQFWPLRKLAHLID